ncbi:MAG: hypothetical protein J0H07_11145 [Sphingobacteriales bacterium]|nr:hypothetical protein [Sphingobacteriales bacterium]
MDNTWELPSDAKPRGYSTNSTKELTARVVFEMLINKSRIKPYLRENDKTPNFDGYLELTDPEGTPTAKIDVQLKTLPESNYENPKFSFEREFVAACHFNANPPILIAVNMKNQVAYWHHVGMETVSDFFSEPDRKSQTIYFAPEHIIDENNDRYIDEWQALYDIVLESKHNSVAQKARIKQLEAEAEKVAKYIEIANLPAQIVQEIHLFLDIYNNLLERDFRAIRNVLYPNYWKIGMAIGAYSFREVSYMLLPIPYTKNDPLIMQFKHLPSMDLFSLWQTHDIRAIVSNSQKNPIRSFPLKYAYEQLSEEIISTIEKNRFPIDDTFAANEYIVAFIDNFTKYLGYDTFAPAYDLSDFKNLLESVIPALESTKGNFQNTPSEINIDIDSYTNNRLRHSNREAIQAIKKRLNEGYVSPFQVTLRSTMFDIDLISYYCNYLNAIGQSSVIRQFIPNKIEVGVGMLDWQAWDRNILLDNVKTFFENLPRIYTGLLNRNFPLLSDQLADKEADITIYTILLEQDIKRQPLLHKLSLKSLDGLMERRTFFYHETECPINSRDMFNKNDYTCVIEGRNYEVFRTATKPLNFLFSSSPTFLYAHGGILK